MDPVSSDQGSQTGLGSTSTRLSDRPGTLSAVVFLYFGRARWHGVRESCVFVSNLAFATAGLRFEILQAPGFSSLGCCSD